jgi:hypothetical protein
MTAQPIEQPAGIVYPAKTLDGITRTLVANANPDVVADFEDALGRAWAAAKHGDTLAPLHDLIEAWWPQAMFWADREDALRILAQAEDIQANGPPADRRPFDREQFIERWEARHGQKLNV